jgi:rhamnulokinase
MSLIAAVDIGASSGRVLTAHLDNDVPVTRQVHRFPNGPVSSGDRWVWPMESLLSHLEQGLAAAADLGARSCGIDTWAVDYAVVDSSGKQVGPVYAYRDSHHLKGIERVRERVPWPDQYRITGIQDMPINTIYQVAAEAPNRVSKDHRMLLVPDFLMYHLTGFMGAEVTNASTTALMDPRTRQWAPELLARLDIPPEFLPEVHEPGRVLGQSRRSGSEALNVICVATHDTASAFVGTPIADRDKALVVSLGTWALVGYEALHADPRPDTAAINLTHELGVEGTIRCLRNVTGMWLFEECRRSWETEDGRVSDPEQLLNGALGAPEFQAIIDVDHASLAAPGQSPETLAGHMIGEIPGHRAGLVRVLLESLVARLAQQIATIERMSGHHRPIVHVVGGASRLAFLMQWLADATGKQVIAGPVEATSLGNAVIQWCVQGEFAGVSEARQAIAEMAEIRTFSPAGDRERWREFAGRLEWEI